MKLSPDVGDALKQADLNELADLERFLRGVVEVLTFASRRADGRPDLLAVVAHGVSAGLELAADVVARRAKRDTRQSAAPADRAPEEPRRIARGSR